MANQTLLYTMKISALLTLDQEPKFKMKVQLALVPGKYT